jgi:hypothetical protein
MELLLLLLLLQLVVRSTEREHGERVRAAVQHGRLELPLEQIHDCALILIQVIFPSLL